MMVLNPKTTHKRLQIKYPSQECVDEEVKVRSGCLDLRREKMVLNPELTQKRLQIKYLSQECANQEVKNVAEDQAFACARKDDQAR